MQPSHAARCRTAWLADPRAQLCPTCSSGDLTGFPPEMELAPAHRGVSRLPPPLCSHPAQTGAAPAGFTPAQRTQTLPGVGGTGRWGIEVSHIPHSIAPACTERLRGPAKPNWQQHPSHPRVLDLESSLGMASLLLRGVPKTSLIQTAGQGEGKEKTQVVFAAATCIGGKRDCPLRPGRILLPSH